MTEFTVGWREWVALPSLGLSAIKAKIDTGARTSALHAFAIETFTVGGVPHVRFGVHPIEDRDDIEVWCTAAVHDRRPVISSNGVSELRFIVLVPIRIGDREWSIEVSLSNRETMAHRMLLGRTALEVQGAVVALGTEFQQPRLSFDGYAGIVPRPGRRPLRIAVLTMEPNNESNRRFAAAAKARGHALDFVRTSRCTMTINTLGSTVAADGEALPAYDAVIPRIGPSITSYGLAVTRQFEMTGAFCLNGATAIANSRDKLLAHQIMAMGGLPMPATAFAASPLDTDALIESVGGPPLVVKLLQSTQGKGVVLAENRKSAQSVIDAFRNAAANFLVQEFIADAAGSDIRCIVLAGKVVAAMRREAAPGDFRANLHKGGTASLVKVTAEERRMAIRAAKRLGLGFAGVDILRSGRGPLLIEVNSSPGLAGIEAVSGVDVAGLVIDALAQRVRPERIRERRPAALAAA